MAHASRTGDLVPDTPGNRHNVWYITCRTLRVEEFSQYIESILEEYDRAREQWKKFPTAYEEQLNELRSTSDHRPPESDTTDNDR